MSNYMSQYGERLDEAGRAVRAVLPREAPTNFVDSMINAVNDELMAKFQEGMGHLHDVSEVLDCMEFILGQPPAETFARKNGIRDESILEKVREFGFHQAALWIQLRVEGERDLRAAEARLNCCDSFDDYDDLD